MFENVSYFAVDFLSVISILAAVKRIEKYDIQRKIYGH